MPTRTNRVSTNAALWTLLALSVLTIVGGIALALPRIQQMDDALTNGTITTGTEVYVGQAWITFGTGVTTAGIVGLFVALAALVVATTRATAVATVPAATAHDDVADVDSTDETPVATAAPVENSDDANVTTEREVSPTNAGTR